MNKSDPVTRILGPGGLLDQQLTGYEPRPQQLKMAQTVWRAFQGDKRAIVEAATGTGKTLAYLIPALLSGKQVVVSTATKALQSQVIDKDIPLLAELLQRADPPIRVNAVVLKGRTNYLCKFRYESQRSTITFINTKEASHWGKITRWAKRTPDGDRGTIEGLPDVYQAWTQISATGQQCHGNRCAHYEDCFVTRRRREARDANIIVVNHHLFFADLALKKTGATSSLLPSYDAVIFDEAHHLEHTATGFFGTQISSFRLKDLVGDVRRALESEDALTRMGQTRLLGVETASEGFFDVFKSFGKEGRHPLEDLLGTEKEPKPLAETVKMRCEILTDELESLATWLETAPGGSVTERLMDRTRATIGDVVSVTTPDRPGYCHIIERRGRGVFLEAVPIHIGGLFRANVLDKEGAQIYTSATLTAEGKFDFFMDRLGMKNRADVITVKLGSVFDYPNNALLYVPRRLPAPTQEGWLGGVCKIVEYLVNMTEGRAFVLFTSYKNMELVFEALEEKLEFPLFKQGDAPKGELLEAFRADVHSVLFATGSFWEGVDVEGESLSLVIMDKLPFPNHTEPLTQARMRQLEEDGGNPFFHFQIPTAVIALKQGFGRLIRSKRDHGMVAILDSRLESRRYGDTFLRSLPPAPVVWNAWEARAWWEDKSGED